MSRRLGLAATLAAAAAIAVGTTTIAHADSGYVQIKSGTEWARDATAPLFDVSHIYPGWTGSADLAIRNDTDDSATFAVTAVDIVDLENGCMHSEAVVDATCGPDEGELSRQLQLSAFLDPDDDGTFEATPRWTGTLADLTTAAVLTDDLAPHAVVGLRMDATLPTTSGNETQTDLIDFDLRLDLAGTGSAATTRVEGARHTRQQPGTGVLGDVTDSLPFTGSPAERLVAGGLWLTILGACALMLARTRRRRLA
jgi:hypothetical protein